MKFRILLLLSLFLLLAAGPAAAQEEEPDGPVYVVEQGDTLYGIALQFGVTVDDLVSANGLSDANSLFVGDRLIIPGLDGINGVLTTTTVPLGSSLRRLSLAHQVPLNTLVRLNRLVSPQELFIGAPLVITEDTGDGLDGLSGSFLPSGLSLLELAAAGGQSPWEVAAANGMDTTQDALPGDIIYLQDAPGAAFAPQMPLTAFDNTLFYQGDTGVLHIRSSVPVSLQGSFGPYTFVFTTENETDYYALQGIDALEDPGMYPLSLSVDLADGTSFSFVQWTRIFPVDYILEFIQVDQELLDLDLNQAELAQIRSLVSNITGTKYWDGPMQTPSFYEDCINSTYGNRRSYNGSAFIYYHNGLDFCGGVGTQIFAPARGVVVHTAEIAVRGNYTVIDHGWGVYSAYAHQSEVFVSVGDVVEPGQLIGLIGNTGRSTGPHLHFEIWVNGVAVNPSAWLEQVFP